MKIETKYDIGDKVWVVCRRGIYDVFGGNGAEQAVISAVHFHKNEYGNKESYDFESIYQSGSGLSNIFPTKKQAQAECDKRNKKG